MANLTQFTGGTSTSDGTNVGSWIGSQAEYDALSLVSDISLPTYDVTSDDFFPGYEHTLFYITG